MAANDIQLGLAALALVDEANGVLDVLEAVLKDGGKGARGQCRLGLVATKAWKREQRLTRRHRHRGGSSPLVQAGLHSPQPAAWCLGLGPALVVVGWRQLRS